MPQTNINTLRAIADKAKTEARGLHPAEARAFDEAEAEYLSATGLAVAPGERAVGRLAHYEAEEAYHQALLRYIRYGKGSGQNPEWSADVRILQERALASADGQTGGFLLSEQMHGRVIASKDAIGGIASVATRITTANGRDYPVPTFDGSAETGALIAENEEDEEGTDADFGQAKLFGWSFTSKVIKVPIQLLEDSDANLAGHIADRLGKRLARAEAPYFSGGAGPSADQPQGLMTSDGLVVGHTATATNSITRSELVALEASVDRAYRPGAAFILSPGAETALKGAEASGIVTFPEMGDGRLLGHPYVVDDGLGAVATGQKPVVFGDPKAFWVRQVGPPRLIRMDEMFVANGQVGFVATERVDSTLVDQGGALKYLVMA